MAETTNYKLYVEDNDEARFRDWRTKMNGTNDSNMVKIDTALKEKADSSHSVTVTLTAGKWSGTKAPFTQAISVSGLGSNQNGMISVAQGATADQRQMASEAVLSVLDQSASTLTIVADGEKPDIDIPVTVVLFG